MTTGQRIQQARKSAGLSQKQLGEKLGLSASMIRQWENDLRNPKLETLIRIAKGLGVPVASLLDGDPLELGAGLRGYKVNGRVFLTKESMDMLKELASDKWKKESEEIEAMLSELEAEKDAPSELKILQAYHKLNLDGQYEAVKRVEELTEIPRYQATTAPQSMQALPEGNTAPEEKPSEDL